MFANLPIDDVPLVNHDASMGHGHSPPQRLSVQRRACCCGGEWGDGHRNKNRHLWGRTKKH